MLESLINPTQSGRLKKINNYYHIKSIFDFNEVINGTNLMDYNSKINPLNKENLKKYLIDRKLI